MFNLSKETVKAFFFEAQRKAGWAFTDEGFKDFPLPGFEMRKYTNGKLAFVDMWHTTPGSKFSAGETVIYIKNPDGIENIVWYMQYSGWYEREAIPTVKLALQKAYKEEEFCGGRGPEIFTNEPYVYKNNDTMFSTFGHFSGKEFVDYNGIVGIHEYNGRWVL